MKKYMYVFQLRLRGTRGEGRRGEERKKKSRATCVCVYKHMDMYGSFRGGGVVVAVLEDGRSLCSRGSQRHHVAPIRSYTISLILRPYFPSNSFASCFRTTSLPSSFARLRSARCHIILSRPTCRSWAHTPPVTAV